jgi:glutamine amidotransferase
MSTELGLGDVIVTSDPDQVRRADRIVLPGDGAFPACRAQLFDHRGLFEAMDEAVRLNARPFLGICIGMQMLATQGLEYTPTDGFDWIAGTVTRITPSTAGLKVPHMGWNDLVIDHPHPVFEGISSGQHTYFVHSYHMLVDNPAHRLAHVDYGGPVTAMVGRDTIVGMQFHPEKSQTVGLQMIGNFLRWRP